ncbi:MAG: type II CAAX endopeptidase family protein [Oscillospiraceae bacterium]
MEKRTFNILGFGLLATALATAAGQSMLSIILTLINPELLTKPWANLAMIPMLYLFGLPSFFIFTKNLPVSPPLEHEPVTFKNTSTLYFICMSCTYIFGFVGNIVTILINLINGKAASNPVADLVSGANPFLILLIVGLLSPIVEEYLFRKLLLDRLRPFGDKVAIIYSGLMFGLFHMNLSQFFYAAVLGMLLAYITLKTGNIKQSAILHIAINITGSVIMPRLILSGNTVLTSVAGLIIVSLVTVGVILFATNRTKLHLNQAPFSFSRPITAKLQYMNIGTILFMSYCIFMFVMYAMM